jgi:hypothetical protein
MNAFETALKKYLAVFADQEMYFVNDTRNLELYKSNPSNKNVDDIRTKISAISDDPQIKQLTNSEELITHILNLKIDDRIQRGDLSLVEDIAHVTIQGNPQNLLHFASVYCNLHRPDIFPIYSDQYLGFYKEYLKQNKLSLDPEKLNTYTVFSAALDDLLTRYGLKGKMNYLHIRKFGWLYLDHVMKEAQQKT